MEITKIYAILVGGCFLARMVYRFQVTLLRSWNVAVSFMEHLRYRQLIDRHQHVGPWSYFDLAVHVLFVFINAFCTFPFFRSSLTSAGLRAARLSLINIIPVLAGLNMSILADLLAMPMSLNRQLHRSAAMMSIVLVLFHVAVELFRKDISFPLHEAKNLFSLVVGHPLYKTEMKLRRLGVVFFVRNGCIVSPLFTQKVVRALSLDAQAPGHSLRIRYLETLELDATCFSNLYLHRGGRV